MSNRQQRRNAKLNRRKQQNSFLVRDDFQVPDFVLDDTDKFYLMQCMYKNRDWSKPLPGEQEWEIRRFGWSRWPIKVQDTEF